jgi:drug/metabolite transporter (DMT)-like permease
MKNIQHLKAHIAVLIANFIFGANISVVKFITPSLISPIALNVARVVISLLLFWILFLIKPLQAGIQKKHIGRFVLCGLTGVAINQVLFIKGVSLTTSIHSSLLLLITPILITFFAAWLVKEKLNKYKIIGLILGVMGAVLLIMLKENSAHATNIILGDTFIVLNAISYAFYMVLVKPLMEVYKPIHVLRWVFTFGTFMILPFGISDFAQTQWNLFNFYNWLALVFIVIAATFIAYLFTIYGINKIGASVTGAYIYTQPIFAASIAIIFMGEQVYFQKIIAAILIFTGVYLVSKKVKKL